MSEPVKVEKNSETPVSPEKFTNPMALIAHLTGLNYGAKRVKLVLSGENENENGKHTFEGTFDEVLPEVTNFLGKFGDDYPEWKLKIVDQSSLIMAANEL